MRHVAGREFELKLELTPEQMQRVDVQPILRGWTVGEPSTRTLRSIYFDTPDQRLRSAGISLRVRWDGDKWVQTVKSGTRLNNGVSHPNELEVSLSGPEPDLRSISESKLRRKILGLTNGSPLEPIFETEVKRTARQLHMASGDIELALDEGVVRSGKAETALCEAELELKAGSPSSLLELATQLFADENVRLSEGSKADRGYDLATGRNKDAPHPKRAEEVYLAKGMTCREALALCIQSAAEQIIANRPVLLETDDPEAAHQLRIGLRRLRRRCVRLGPSWIRSQRARWISMRALWPGWLANCAMPICSSRTSMVQWQV